MGERVVLFDDLDGTEDATVERHSFEFEGVRCEIDLTQGNWARMYAAVKPFLDKARQEGVIEAPRSPVQPRTRVVPVEVPQQREPAPVESEPLPMSGGFGDYTWESDGTMHPKTSHCTRAERNACMRWIYAHNGRAGQFSRAALEAFRKQDETLIPGWGDPPTEAELAPKVGTVGLVLRDAAEEKQRARGKALAR